ncbi:MAG: peptidylprolyl isomerase [Sedimentisphaerales bacterium]|nr:peptidylprolyl isomerase [Sedimentisphaerales bacterium]
MKIKNVVILSLAVLAAVWICGCGGSKQKGDVDHELLETADPNIDWRSLPRPSGGLALSIDSEAITADEIIDPVRQQIGEIAGQTGYEQFRAKVKPMLGDILIRRIGDIRLYEKAKAALPDNVDENMIDKIIEQEVQRFIAQYGGDYAAAEKVLKSMGTTWKDFYQFQRRSLLVQSFVSEEIKVDKPVTHSELLDYYNSMKNEYFTIEGQLKFRLIDLEVAKFADANDPNVNAEQKAGELAAQLSERIKAGEDFGELAKKYSNDHAAKDSGLWRPIRPGSLAEPYDAIEKAIDNLDIGQVSEPVAEGGHIFIVKLENRQIASCKPFEEVQGDVESRMMYEKRKKRVDDMMDKIISQVDLSYAEGFLEYCTQKAWQDWHVSG